MIKKLAILAIEKADGTVELQAGEKGEIREFARDLIRSLNDNPGHDVAQVTALGSDGILKRRKWKENWPAEVVAPAASSIAASVDSAPAADEPDEPAAEAPEGDLPEFEGDPDSDDGAESEPDEEAEKTALRKKLRDAGVSYSPRSGLEFLRGLVEKNGL